MSPEDLHALITDAEQAGRTEMVLRLNRKPKPDATMVQLVPGVKGRIVQWGDGTWDFPTIAFFQVADLRRAYDKATTIQHGEHSTPG